MVAWKAGRESIRAVNDSLPHLQKAQSVVIVEGKTSSENRDDSIKAINDFLLNHGVKAALEAINAGDFPIGDMLLNCVCDKNIDLLVMGVFAPNRRGKLEMSPVARHVLKHLTVPVLMSH
jgi:nucleotide-binding universal stress UspA family protein